MNSFETMEEILKGESFYTLCEYIDKNQMSEAIMYIQECCECDKTTAEKLFVGVKKDYDRIFSPDPSLTPEQIEYINAKEKALQENKPKCPICNSVNLSKITATKKVVKIAMFGVFGMGDNGKTWKCNNCGSRF